MITDSVLIQYCGSDFRFRAVSADDHILRIISRTRRFYEQDVLERLLERLQAKGSPKGTAIDAGAYIGTHSVFFGRVMELSPVVSFEANPDTMPILRANLAGNGLEDRAIAVNCALGSHGGRASVTFGPECNKGATRISEDATDPEAGVRLLTLDGALRELGISDVVLIKVDVEGAELDVLDGARDTLRKARPLLSVEIHSAAHLTQVLSRLEPLGYHIVDCLGFSPTYIIECRLGRVWANRLINRLWLARAAVPTRYRLTRWYLRRLAQVLTTGRWDPAGPVLRPGHGEEI